MCFKEVRVRLVKANDNVFDNLMTDEKSKIGTILDDNESLYSIAGLTMLKITTVKGQLNDWIKRDDDNTERCFQNGYGEDWMRNRLCFSLIKNKDLLSEWKLEDWKKVIQIGNELKLMQFNNMNELYLKKYNDMKIYEDSLEDNIVHKRV